MIAAGEGRLVANHLEKFEDLNASMADQLIADGYGADVACYLDKFEGLDHQKIAEQMIAVGEVKSIVHYFSKFEGLNVYIAEQMIAAGHGDSVGQNLKKFESLNVFIAEQLIAAGHGVYITSYIDKFEGLDHKKFAEQMIATGHINSVAQNLEKFEGLDHQIANKLIKAGYGRAVGECLDIFEGNDFQTLANSLIQTGCGDVVANNLDRFASLSYSYLAIRLIQAGQGAAVAQNIDKFSGLNLQEIMIMIIDDHRGYAIAQNLEKFEGLNQQEIVERLIGKGQGSAITENLEKFEGINQQDLINRLIEENQYYAITNNLNKFNNLSFEFASKLVEEGYILEVILGLKGFDEPEKILISFNSKYCQSADIADAVIENLSAVNLNSNDLKNLLFACAENYSTAQKIKGLDLAGLGLEPEYILELLEQISQMKPELKDIKRSNPYEYTAGSIEYVTITKPGTELHTQAVKINKSLREALKNKESMLCGMAQLTEMLLDQLAEKIAIHEGNEKEAVKKEMGAVYRRLAADYLALELYQMDNQNDISGKIFSDFEHLDLDRQNLLNAGLGEALIKANKHYLNVLDVDTPFYDKIYSEWDTKRIGEKDFQEIFLGRDGIYAFIGRRAQIYARRRMLRPDDIQKHESTMPTYIVYPRYFRDYLSSEAKSVYLRQSIEAPKAAHYYDTGFEGTIPQDIMSILGLPEDQWDARIRLLSANRRQRTVLGLIGDKQERNTLVGNVEHNVKDENSATGLFENSDGRIEPISQPNSPSERLSFALIQQALHRHYYMQELDRQKAVDARFKSVSLGDSELRLSQTLTQTQQQQLIDFFDTPDVGQKLVQDSRIIKMADPQGPFPDEAVFEIDLAETSGSIVKSVVSTKQHGPLDEFEALLLLERLGIDAPKPLGRLFTNEQHGFIVIDKLPGVSGRTIKSYFISENIDTSDQQRLLKDTERMMTTIAETVRRDAGLDKPWRLKDFMIVFGKNDDGKIIIERMLPIDFERATVFDSSKPHSIKLGQDLD